MKIRLLILLLCFLCSITATAQENKCDLKLADLPDSPELFGFRMGMNQDQVKARVPQAILIKPNDFGVAKTSISPDFDTRIDKTTFNGIRTISLDFLDGRVTSLWFGYDSSYKWHTVPEFIEGISQSLHLPAAWTDWKGRGQQLRCNDFLMTVTIVAEGPSFHISDTAAERTIAVRRVAKEEENEASEEEAPEAPVEIIADRKDKVYYIEGCLPLHAIKEGDRIVFKSKAEAEQAGYKLAGRCQ